MLLEIQEPRSRKSHPVKQKGIAIGIDLGTTFSLAAVVKEGKPQIITDPLIPSVVSYLHPQVVIGSDALNDLDVNPEVVVTSVKRLMGRGLADVQGWAEQLLYSIDHDSSETGPLKIQVGDKKVLPFEVAAEILRAVKQQAEKHLEQPVTQAVITVPAYFDEAARLATRDAARLAGIDVLRLVNEPTAAALAYGLEAGSEGTYAIYDLGGGTFDFSILKLQKGVFQVLATAGDVRLGGDDFDLALFEYWRTKQKVTVEERDFKSVLQEMRVMREALTESSLYEGMIDHQLTSFARADLEKVLAPLIEKTFPICKSALQDVGLSIEELDGVVLVGGATRTPLVRKMVRDFFQRDLLCTLSPDQVVAWGAALQAEALTLGSETLLLDVTSLSLGVETMGGIVERIIERQSPIPVVKSKKFTTYQDGQTGLQLHIVQGERELAQDCRSLARFELLGIPPMTAGIAVIEVQFALDADGLLTVMAQEKMTGCQQSVEIKPSYGVTEEDFEQMLQESFKHAKQDIEGRLLIESRLAGKKLLKDVFSALETDSAALLTKEDTEALMTQLDLLDEQVRGNDRQTLEKAIEVTQQRVQPFLEKKLNQSFQVALKGRILSDVAQSLQKT